MSVVVETTVGDITVDLYIKDRPKACLNFLKLCKMKYYNYNLFHTINRDFIAQTGDPTGTRNGGQSIFGMLQGSSRQYFEGESQPQIKHNVIGLVSFVGTQERMIGSQFFITLAENLNYLDSQHCIFGEIVEGLDIIGILNDAICDTDGRPYQDIRITHTVILDDPFDDLDSMKVPSRSPSPSIERLQGGRIAADEEIDETVGLNAQQIEEMIAEREAKARATILEMVGDIPDAEMAPPENVLFVCKLNPVTTDDDLEIIFSRFGKINSCEIIRDRKTGDSLQYAFIEFNEQKSCEDAYFKMDNVLIDDRRIHVDFSQSVAKVKWHGKGRGVTHFDNKGRKIQDRRNEIGRGKYKPVNIDKLKNVQRRSKSKERNYKPSDIRKNYNKNDSNRGTSDTNRSTEPRYSDRSSRDKCKYKQNKYKRDYSSSKRKSSDKETNRRRKNKEYKKYSSSDESDKEQSKNRKSKKQKHKKSSSKSDYDVKHTSHKKNRKQYDS